MRPVRKRRAAEPTSGRAFHSGELRVQRRAGVEQLAARLETMREALDLTGGMSRFLAGRTYAALSAHDSDGRLWVSPLAGAPGLFEIRAPTRLQIHAVPTAWDPLHKLPVGQTVGLIVIEYAARRRVRINGRLLAATATGLDIEVTEAYGNCPHYIPPHPLAPVATSAPATAIILAPRTTLTANDGKLITSADTFILGTTHASRGKDASHRGGPAGFVDVRVDGTTLSWPDYPGNNLFNSLGNLTLNPAAALLFADFTAGTTLHLNGTAAIVWNRLDQPRTAESAEVAETGRSVTFHLSAAVTGPPLPVRRNPTHS